MSKLGNLLTLFLMGMLLSFSALAMASSPKSESIRALHLVLIDVTVGDVMPLVDKAKNAGFNTLILNWRNCVKFKNYPSDFCKGAWSPDDLVSVVDYARKKNMSVIPEVDLLTHQENFLGNSHPDLMFNKTTYDPRKPGVYKLVYAYLDEVISLIKPTAVLIGHDELAGHSEKSKKIDLKSTEKVLPPDLFLQDVVTLNKYLKTKELDTWMWGDMLISPEEFPEMKGKSLHGGVDGYGASLRSKIPKNVVICDWHYNEQQNTFPSIKAFKKDGFRVLGASWKKLETMKNFSRYAAKNGADGMIATTWFHVRRKEWSVVDRIIQNSGKTFLADFPDK